MSCKKVEEINRKFEDFYSIKEPLGSGRFGKVFVAEEKKSGQKFAGKHCSCRNATVRKEIDHEVAIMRELNHPKLLKLYDVYSGSCDMTLVLELVSGGELFDRIVDDSFDLTEALAASYVRQICEGVAYMHSLQILHLDIKPENILCLRPDRLDRIKIIDFGFARRYSPNSPLKVMFGTPEFVAPEVVNYEPLGKGTDVWSIGVVTYVLLSGLSPFMADSEQETLSNVTACDVEFDDECFDEITDDARSFILNLLVPRESDRPSCEGCMGQPWLHHKAPDHKCLCFAVCNLKKFVCRRKWMKTINAVIAMNRLQAGGRRMALRSCDDGPHQESTTREAVTSS